MWLDLRLPGHEQQSSRWFWGEITAWDSGNRGALRRPVRRLYAAELRLSRATLETGIKAIHTCYQEKEAH